MDNLTKIRVGSCLLALAFLLATTSTVRSQVSQPARWGSVDPADLAMRYYAADPSAAALVLSDYLITGYYTGREGVNLRSQRHRRVKYFEGFAHTRDPIRIEWYDPLEEIVKLQARLYLPNGQVRKLRKRDFRLEPVANGWKRYVLKLPKFPDGTILEYRYLLNSKYFDELPSWYFQEQYPVRRSEFRGVTPASYDYVALATPDTSKLTIFSKEEFSFAGAPYGYILNSYSRSANYLRLVAEALPPIAEELYTNNAVDYIPQVQLRLRAFNWPGEPTQPLYPTWPELADSLRADTTFGHRYLARDSVATVLRDLAPTLAPVEDTLQRVRLAYRALAERLTWNGTYAARATRSPDAVWAARTGTSAELNLTLLAVLRELGIPAYPVLVGTRDSGVPTEQLAQFEQFDHVLVVAQIGAGALFCDLDGTFRPAGLPRPESLNNRGWLVTDAGQTWIDLRPPPSEQVVVAELALDTTGVARGRLSAKMTGYYAAFARERLAADSTIERGPLLSALRAYYPDAQPLGRTVEAQDSIATTLRIDLDCRLPLGQRADDGMSLYPVLLPALEAALATAPPRQFPLDMPFPWSEQFLLFLDLPAGYTVETLPEPAQLRSPDGRISFDYSVRQAGRRLVVQYRLTVGQSFYSATAYEAAVAEIFTTAIDRQDGELRLRCGD